MLQGPLKHASVQCAKDIELRAMAINKAISNEYMNYTLLKSVMSILYCY